MRSPRIWPVATVLLLAACTDGGDTSNQQAGGSNAVDLTPEGPSLTARLFGGGKPVPLSIQNAHPSGMVLQVDSIQAKPTETVLGVTVINGDSDEQTLNRFPNNRNGYLLSANGERLYLSPPPTNAELRIGAGQRLQGELVFLGRMQEGGGATLVLNEGRDTGSEYTNSPGFRIPIQLGSAAFTDDGSKKKSVA